MQMHAFTDPYLNVKLHTCLCQQLNYTIKNECADEKVGFRTSKTDNKCKSAYAWETQEGGDGGVQTCI
jgi:hypothetical protein